MKQVSLVSLTPQQVIEAKAEARRLVTLARGEKPDPATYTHSIITEYPAWLVRLLAVLLMAIVICAWLVSAIRLYHLGYQESLHAISPGISGASGGIAAFTGIVLVLLSELTVLGAIISRKVLFAPGPENAFPRGVLMAVAVFATILAIVANISVTHAHERLSDITFQNAPTVLFVTLEACIPLVILGISLALEQLVLKQVKERQHALKAYSRDLATWEAAGRDSEKHPDYHNFLLQEAYRRLLEANSSGRGRAERIAALEALPQADLLDYLEAQISNPLAAAGRALKAPEAEAVLEAPALVEQPTFLELPLPQPNGNGNGKH